MFILLALVALNTSHAANFSNVAAPATKYFEKALCESTEGVECFDVTDCPTDECGLVDVDDTSRPKFTKAQVEACDGEVDCRSMLELLQCTAGSALIAGDFSQVYCAVPNGFEQKKALQRDEAKTAAKVMREAQLKAREDLAAKGRARREVGEKIIDLISANNDSKSMTPAQTVQLTQALAPIIGLLQTGALQSAKALVQQLQPSGVITQADIDLTLAQFAIEGF